MKKRILSIVLAICLLLTLVPTTAFADLTKETYVVAGISDLCGSNWDPNPEASPDNVMTDNDGDGTYQKVYTNVAVMDGYQFKVVKYTPTGEQTWYGIDGGIENFNFNVKSVCDVTITFDTATLKITVTGDGVEIPTTLNVESMRTVGNGDGNWLNDVNWDPAADENLMAEVSPGVFEITYTDLDEFDNYQVKFAANGSWAANWGGAYEGSGIESDAVYNSSDNITIEVPYELADVTLRLDLTNFDYATKTGAKFTVTVVDKASTNSKSTEPRGAAYATKAQLMDDTFAPDADGYDTNIGKLAFGKNNSGTAQEWYILGKDTGIDGDNTVIFAESPMSIGTIEGNGSNKTYDSQWGCTYPDGTTISEVYRNHYGASVLRGIMNYIATDTSCFTTAEQGLMNYTTVTTADVFNNADYTTTDKLYALQGALDETIIYAGSSDQIALATESYWCTGDNFWLRSPADGAKGLSAIPSYSVIATTINEDGTYVQPASNLNLTKVLFSSAATANPSMDGPSYGTIAPDKAMVLRLDGSSMDIGTVEYDPQTDTIKAQKGSISGKVALVVQGKNIVQKQDEIGETDWFFSVRVDGEYSINADVIKEAFGFSSVNFEKCKIWIETVGTDKMIYAVGNNSSSSQKDKLLSITAPQPKTVANGTTYENMNLPDTVEIETEGNTATSAPVSWDTTTPASGSYDPNKLTEQTVTLNGAVTCPDDVDDNGVPLKTTITITISAADTVKAPQANLESGTYPSNQSVELSSATEGADIYYTLDGTTPSRTNGTKYTGAISITGTEAQSVQTTIKAIAVKDKMQDSSVKTFIYTIQIPDTTLPTGEIKVDTNSWKAFFNGITFDLFFKNSQTVTITASDNSGKAVKIEYLLSGEELTVAQLNSATFTAYTGEFRINPDNEYVIYARLTDSSNNVKYINSNGIVLDATAPVITGVENGKTYCEEQTVTVTDKYLDSVTLDGAEVLLDASNQFTLSAADAEQTIVATDKAGNKTQITATVKNGHTDADDDHICDDCGEIVSNHIDNDDDGICDICSADIDSDSNNSNTKNENTNTSKKSPQTGIDGETALLLAFLLSCGGAIVVTGAYSKRKKHSAK